VNYPSTTRGICHKTDSCTRWTAVARGACLRGLEGLSIVSSHISPLSYGVHCLRTVASGPGNPPGSYVCPLTGQTKIPNRVNWLIRKVSFRDQTRHETPKTGSELNLLIGEWNQYAELTLAVKGATITSDKAISLPFVYPVPLNHCLTFGTTLLACNKPYAPRNAKNRSSLKTPPQNSIYIARHLTTNSAVLQTSSRCVH
jgi:hypothetical protein